MGAYGGGGRGPRKLVAAPPRLKRGHASKKQMRRFDGIEFQFLSLDAAVTEAGSVAIRDDIMVIDIPQQRGGEACLVEGRLSGHVYVGENILRHEVPLRIEARWIDVGGIYAGTWLEEGTELFFSFRLPRVTSRNTLRSPRE